jgi:hypothetical protein
MKGRLKERTKERKKERKKKYVLLEARIAQRYSAELRAG